MQNRVIGFCETADHFPTEALLEGEPFIDGVIPCISAVAVLQEEINGLVEKKLVYTKMVEGVFLLPKSDWDEVINFGKPVYLTNNKQVLRNELIQMTGVGGEITFGHVLKGNFPHTPRPKMVHFNDPSKNPEVSCRTITSKNDVNQNKFFGVCWEHSEGGNPFVAVRIGYLSTPEKETEKSETEVDVTNPENQ